ncbi:hypothetical protein OC846_002548 [Tilletia horrida]|uniref:ferric-chelate reductase (NADPH) n=1 Tax=Tilletia horrida TaxID=155126 RepID=A0AAN6GRU7_9BASI|nr:hypothetical protein OC846_002548 [Tilletia horrida]
MSLYVPPNSNSGGGGLSNNDATRSIQYNYVRNYMIAHVFSWPSYRYIYLQTIIFTLAFLIIGIMHHYQYHERSIIGVRWSKWSTKNRVIKLGRKEKLSPSQQYRPPAGQHFGAQNGFTYPPTATSGAVPAASARMARAVALNRTTVFSDDDDHASIEGAVRPSLFTRIANIPRWLFNAKYRQAARDAKLAKELRRQAKLGRNKRRRIIEFPSFGRLIVLCFITAVPLALTFIGADYINPNSSIFDFRTSWVSARDAYLYSIGGVSKRQPVEWGIGYYPTITTNAPGFTLPYRDWWTAGNRVGDFAFAMTPLVVIVALKQVPWALLSTKWMGGLAFDKLSFLHKYVGRMIWVFATAHVAAWSVQLARDTQYNQSMWNFIFWWVKFRWGIVAYVFLTLLMIFSLSPFRMDTYEWFYAAHVVCAFGFLLTSALHHPPLWPWMGVSLIWWALERAHRAFKMARVNGVGPFARKQAYRPPGMTNVQQSFSSGGHNGKQPPSMHISSPRQPDQSPYEKSAGPGTAWGQPLSHATPQHPLAQSGDLYGRSHPSTHTASSHMSESTYVESSQQAHQYSLNYRSQQLPQHQQSVGTGGGPSSSSSTTPVSSPPMNGGRVVGAAVPNAALGGIVQYDGKGSQVVPSAEEMYTGAQRGGRALVEPSIQLSDVDGMKSNYRPDLQSYPKETDLGDGNPYGRMRTGMDTPPAVGIHSGANQSRVHLLAPGAPGTPGGAITPGGGGSEAHSIRGLSPNPSALDLARTGSQQPLNPNGFYQTSFSGRRRRLAAVRAALPPHVEAILKPGHAFAEVMPGQTVRLTMRTPSSMMWRPGQYVNLNVPSVAWWQSHPFTIANAYSSVTTPGGLSRVGAFVEKVQAVTGSTTKDGPDEEDQIMVLIIRARQGFTLSLWEYICRLRYKQIEDAMRAGQLANIPQKHQTGVQIRALVDGPYGSTGRIHWGAHSTVMIICGGSGISFGLSVLEDLCTSMVEQVERQGRGEDGGFTSTAASSASSKDRRAFLTRRIRFVWILREFVHLQWAASALRRCVQMLSPAQLQVDIFVTHFNDQGYYERQAAGMANLVSAADHGEMQARMASGGKPGASKLGSAEDGNMYLSAPHNAGLPGTFASGSEIGSLPASPSFAPSMVGQQPRLYTERAARFTEGPEQDEYEVEAEDLTNFEGEAEGGLSRAEMEMNRAVQKEGKLRRAHTKKMSMRGRGRNGGASKLRSGEAVPGASQDGAGGYLAASEMAAFSEAYGGGPVPTSQPLRPHLWQSPTRPNAQNGTFQGQTQSGPNAPAANGEEGETETPIDLDEREDEDMRVVAELARPGHPKLDKIVREECENSMGRVMISSCGPASLGTVLRSIATKQMDPQKVKEGDLRYQVNVVTESFEWGGS